MADEQPTVATKARSMLVRLRLPRTTCPLCGREVALRRAGQLYQHRRFDGLRFVTCTASRHTPEGAVAAEFSRAREIANQARKVFDVQ